MAAKKNDKNEGIGIGTAVKALRSKSQLTLQDLAAKTGLPRNVLSEIEEGETIPPVATLLKLANALNVGMAAFFETGAAAETVSVTRKGERKRISRRPHHHEGEVDYVYESLETKKPDKHMEPLLVEFMPMETADMVFTSHRGRGISCTCWKEHWNSAAVSGWKSSSPGTPYFSTRTATTVSGLSARNHRKPSW